MATLDEEQIDEEIAGDDLEERVSPAIRAAIDEEPKPGAVETVHERKAREDKQRYERIQRGSRAFVERLPRPETLPTPGKERRAPGTAGRALAGGASDQVKNRLKQGVEKKAATAGLTKVIGLLGPYGKAAQLALEAFKYRKYLIWAAVGVIIFLGAIVVLIAVAIGAAFSNPASAGTSQTEPINTQSATDLSALRKTLAGGALSKESAESLLLETQKLRSQLAGNQAAVALLDKIATAAQAIIDAPSNKESIRGQTKIIRETIDELVTLLNPRIAIDPTGSLGADNLRTLSAQYLGLPYGRSAKLRREEGPQCLDCQTLVERVMADALTPHFGSLSKAVSYIITGNGKTSRIVTPIPGWLHPAYDWPAREATREVAESLGLGSLPVANWNDYSGGLGTVSLNYIPWSQVGSLQANETIDGTIIAFIGNPISNGVTHVGLLFSNNGQVILRHAGSRKTGVLDVSLAERARGSRSRYTGIILLRPDSSRLR